MEDKMIHKDEFRLRLLLTNMCNKNCYFCLNDFQPKPNEFVDPIFLDTERAIKIIDAYCSFMREKGEQQIVTFSGGEPGLHKDLAQLANVAILNGAITKIVTNGFAFNYQKDIKRLSCWHVGVTDIQPIPEMESDTVIQIVVTDRIFGQQQLDDFISYYTHQGYRVKLFEDFYNNTTYPRNTIELMKTKYGQLVESRHTGIQENRGKACEGCTRKCVTLKALWVFPGGIMTTCPQLQRKVYNPWIDGAPRMESVLLKEAIEEAYELHKA